MHEAADAEVLRRWWRRWPEANVGVVTGAVSGLVVLDVDPRNGGDGSLAALEFVHGALLPTVEVLTGGGGRHLYYRHPGTTVAGRPVAPGLDVKGDGGLVVCPPSLHASGLRYRWAPNRAPGEIPLAPLPWWIGAAVRDRDGATRTPGRRPAPVRSAEERAEFARLWRLLGVAIGPGDRTYLCPLHPDRHPSLHIDAEGCRFYCFGCGRGGGSGRLGRLLGLPGRARADDGPHHGAPGPAAPVRPAGTLGGDVEVRVVGTGPYQGVLLELTGGRRTYGGAHVVCTARLVPEPDNAFDPGAVAVTIAGRRVGYLSRPDAARYRRLVGVVAASGETSCPAVVLGGWEREHGRVGMFGVRLHLVPRGAEVPLGPGGPP